jgi:phage gpG-like protein
MASQTKNEMRVNLVPLENMQRELQKKYIARVGILSNTPHGSKKGESIGMTTLGIIQEFGSTTANIPPRSFLRMPIEVKRNEIIQYLKSPEIKKLVEAGDILGIMKRIGIKGQAIVQEAFATRGFGSWAPNKPATIKAKGSDAPLVDSGALRRSITSDVVKS